MANFVLVHGAWHGSWCWKRVRPALQSAGHTVFTPTLTGVGERAHLLARNVDLRTLVYLDAFVPDAGQSLHDRLPPEQRQMQLDLMGSIGEGWKVPPIPAEVF